MSDGTRSGEPLVVTDDAIRALVDDQFPHLADQELGRRYTLEDHFAIRIGDHHGALFPRFVEDDSLFARAADLLAPHLERWTFPVSAPVATGRPGHGYPCHWTLVDWVSASTAGFVPLQGQSAGLLGAALRQIHTPAPPASPANPRTSPRLADLLPEWERLLAGAVHRGAPENRVLDVDAATAMFRDGVDAPLDAGWSWTHGRIEPRALMSDRGHFCGILIWQNFGAGDPAADLGGAATAIPLEMLADLHAGYGGVSPTTARRARSYQLLAALGYVEIDDPFLARLAWERMIELGLVGEG